MSRNIGETLIDYGLLGVIRRAFKFGVFEEYGDKSENEDRHISELHRRMAALDEKEVFVAMKAFIELHPKTVVKTLEYFNAERKGNNNETD